MTAVSSLMKILRRHVGLFFPKDARTLLKFPEKVHETILSGQNYNFFEPTNILRKFFNEYYDKFNERPDDVTLLVNIDGVSPFKNAKYGAGVWSVLCKVNGQIVKQYNSHHGCDRYRIVGTIL